MRVTVRGATGFPTLDPLIPDMVSWLGPCYGETLLPVRVTFVRARGRASGGSAYWPVTDPNERSRLHKGCSLGTYEVVIRVSKALLKYKYPKTWTYRKGSGPVVCLDAAEAVFHTLAHELRHVEQFDGCRRAWAHGLDVGEEERLSGSLMFPAWERKHYRGGSCEVDAEIVARDLLHAWRDGASGASHRVAVDAPPPRRIH